MGGQVQRVVADFQLNFHFRVLSVESGKGRADMTAPEAQRSIDPNQSLGRGAAAADQLLKFVDLGEDARSLGKIQLAFGRQAHRARGAVDQADTQTSLQRRQAFAHCRRRNAKLPGGGGEAAFVGQ
ncbi:hypothetical protein D3C84_840890 [compost metagenome]